MPYFYEFVRGPIDPFAPILWNAPLIAIAYGFAASERYWSNDFAFNADYTVQNPESAMVHVLFFALVGLGAMILGYYHDWGRRIGASLPRFESGWSSRRAWIVIGVMLALGLYGFVQLLPHIGTGPRSHLARGDTRGAFILVNLLGTASILVAADVLISAVSYDTDGITVHDFRRLLVGVPLVLINVRILWMLGGRARAFGIFVIVAFLVHYLFRRFSLREGVVILLGVKFLPSWAASIAASAITLDAAGLRETLLNPVVYDDAPKRPFNNVVVLFDGVPDRQGFTYGETFAAAFFEILPVQPFREANQVYNTAFFRSLGGDFGVPLTMLGELYLNFWIPGVVVGFVLIGIVMRTTYEWLVIYGATYGQLVLFGTIANNFLLMGNFSNDLPSLGLSLLPVVLSMYIITDGINTSPLALSGQDA